MVRIVIESVEDPVYPSAGSARSPQTAVPVVHVVIHTGAGASTLNAYAVCVNIVLRHRVTEDQLVAAVSTQKRCDSAVLSHLYVQTGVVGTLSGVRVQRGHGTREVRGNLDDIARAIRHDFISGRSSDVPRLGSDRKIVDAHTVVVSYGDDALTIVAVVNRIVELDLEVSSISGYWSSRVWKLRPITPDSDCDPLLDCLSA